MGTLEHPIPGFLVPMAAAAAPAPATFGRNAAGRSMRGKRFQM